MELLETANPIDATRIAFADDGGDGIPVALYGGFLDSIETVQASKIAEALPAGEFRRIVIDHRGLGRSDKPHDAAAYAMRLRAADAVAVLDALDIERAHFVGMSWGGRLCFGIGEHAPARTRSLTIGGQQPYAWPDSPLTRAVSDGLVAARTAGVEALVEALARYWKARIPDQLRDRYMQNDAVALEAMWSTALGEGPVATDLASWRIPCLVFMGEADSDFIDGARRAAEEIPGGRFFALESADHWDAHTDQGVSLIDAILDHLRRSS